MTVIVQTSPIKDEKRHGQLVQLGRASLHAEVFADSHRNYEFERLYRYIAWPAISELRLSPNYSGSA